MAVMSSTGEARRDNLTILALDPDPNNPDGSQDGECPVQISHAKLMSLTKVGEWAIREAAELVPEALEFPTAVFEGLRYDEDEPRDGAVGWRCYCTVPEHSFRRNGGRSPPYPGQVFLVFVNDQGVAYNWRWEKADEDNAGFPRNHKTRFHTRLMPLP